jgi:2-polyprenyl-6-hydroxyphenyl methylase/3-demethylubiquinone-9 3-methyltransferase
MLAIAIYRKTPRCTEWAVRKARYVAGGPLTKACMVSGYVAHWLWRDLRKARNPWRRIRDYAANESRGMTWWTNVIDWVGGYPYESADPEEVERFLAERGFALTASFGAEIRSSGRLGTHCVEYRFQRRRHDDPAPAIDAGDRVRA